MKLTPKQEKFVQGLISGLSQREAYKQAYNCKTMQDKTIDNKAYILFKKGEIRARYDELLDSHKKKALWTREDAVKELLWIKDQSKSDIEEAGIRQANSNAFLGAIKELNELEDIYLSSKERRLLEQAKFETEKAKKAAETEHITVKTNLLRGASNTGEQRVMIIDDIALLKRELTDEKD